MASFGELVLVLGDLNIPERANAIPENFQRMLVPNKMQHVICTGNCSREQFNELCALAPNVHAVRGDYDDDDRLVFPEVQIIQVGKFRIGLMHGHQLMPSSSSQDAKSRMRRKLNVDVFISGHTHKNDCRVDDDGFFYINPGSITGSYSSINPDGVVPSFILLAIQDTKLVCYVYELTDDGELEVEVTKTEFTKRPDSGAAATPGNNNPGLLQSLLT